MNKYLKEKNGSLCTNGTKTVLGVNGRNSKPIMLESADSWSQMIITTAEELPCGVPVQIQFEIIPEKSIGYTKRVNGTELIYCATFLPEIVSPLSPPDVAPGDCISRTYIAAINFVKARVKPGSAQFADIEEKYLNDIINGTENEDQMKKCAQRRAEMCKKLEDNANRFTGLELSDV